MKKNCLICKREYIKKTKTSIKQWNKSRFCSIHCKSMWLGEKYKGKKSPVWVNINRKKTCEVCQKEFLVNKPCLITKRRFCSEKCFYKHEKTDIKKIKRLLEERLKQQTMRGNTSIEKKVYQELKNRGLLFEKQYLVNSKFLVDAYIPSLNLIIEADGDYWHALERVKKQDKAKNAYLTKCGFNLLRLSETEINNTNFGERIG